MNKIIVIITMLALVSCKKDTKQQVPKNTPHSEEVMSSDIDLNHVDTRSNVVFTEDAMNSIYTQYLQVKKGLVNSNVEFVQQEAKKLESFIEETNGMKQLKATAKLISLTKEIQKQRDFFVTLTSEVEKLVLDADITAGEVYKQFCPMAFEGAGGYWLSDSKEVRNPYYGHAMLKCGSVHKTIQ